MAQASVKSCDREFYMEALKKVSAFKDQLDFVQLCVEQSMQELKVHPVPPQKAQER